VKVGDLVKLKSPTLDDRLAIIIGPGNGPNCDVGEADTHYRVFWLKIKIIGVPAIKDLELVSEGR